MVQRVIIIALIVLVFGAFMTTYTVRFNERAVTTTFGRADEASVITEPGLHFKIPFVQRETKYDARTRIIQSDQETQQTQDNQQIIVSTYLNWRIDDPLRFYRRFSGSGSTAREQYREAEQVVIKPKLRAAMSEVSRFRLDQLLSQAEAGSKIPDLEKQILANLTRGGKGDVPLSDYGITPVVVGVSGVVLPQETTKVVFERMKGARLNISNATVIQGTSQAGAIRATAESEAKRITAFAEQLARTIRTRGDIEAAQFYKELAKDPELAVFIQNMEFMRNAYGRETTFIFPTSMPGFGTFRPDALERGEKGKLPVPDMSGLLTKPPPARSDAPVLDDAPGAKPLQIAAPAPNAAPDGSTPAPKERP